MLKGVYLTLLVGPGVPVPAPQSVTDALSSVQITSGVDKSGFQLTFGVGKTSPLLTTLLPAGYFDPVTTRVILIATVNGVPNVLMDGMITRQDLAPTNEPGKSTLRLRALARRLRLEEGLTRVVEEIRPRARVVPAVQLFPDPSRRHAATLPATDHHQRFQVARDRERVS